jgi:hypothetical protein
VLAAVLLEQAAYRAVPVEVIIVLCRLSAENLSIYLKESQIVTVMHDITELQPVLSHCTDFIYQVPLTIM